MGSAWFESVVFRNERFSCLCQGKAGSPAETAAPFHVGAIDAAADAPASRSADGGKANGNFSGPRNVGFEFR